MLIPFNNVRDTRYETKYDNIDTRAYVERKNWAKHGKRTSKSKEKTKEKHATHDAQNGSNRLQYVRLALNIIHLNVDLAIECVTHTSAR